MKRPNWPLILGVLQSAPVPEISWAQEGWFDEGVQVWWDLDPNRADDEGNKNNKQNV